MDARDGKNHSIFGRGETNNDVSGQEEAKKRNYVGMGSNLVGNLEAVDAFSIFFVHVPKQLFQRMRELWIWGIR